jgi:hypothetical protein
VSVSEILNDAFAGYRVLWRYLGMLSLALTVIVVLFSIVLVLGMGMTGVYAAIVVSLVASFWITALLVQTVDDLGDDEEAETSFGARFARFWPHVNRVSVAALLLSLVHLPGWLLLARGQAVLGLLLVLVAVVVSVWLVLAIPLIVIEGYGVGDAFVESKNLVSGHALKVFGALFLTGFVTGLVSGLVERISLSATDSWAVTLVAASVFDALVTVPITALVLVVIYQTLRHPAAAPTAAPATA